MNAQALSPELTARFGPDPAQTFRANIAAVEARIDQACKRSDRDRSSVRLLPVTKTVPAEILRLANLAGLQIFAENKVQEAQGKSQELMDLPVRWAIVGHLQTNKIKTLVAFADEFHALDSLRLAEKLDARLARDGRVLPVYVQVNTSREDSKFGLSPNDVSGFLEDLQRFPRLKPKGLMTLAVLSGDMGMVRPCFRLLRELRDDVSHRFPDVSELSMGMSGDFEVAIEEGASVVRVGQAIFGSRPTPDSHYWPEVSN